MECALGEAMVGAGSLAVAGVDDYDDKCSCPTPCGEGSFCSRTTRGCMACLQWGIEHPLLCKRHDFSSAAVGECKEKCLPRSCRLSSECDNVTDTNVTDTNVTDTVDEDYGYDYDYDYFNDTLFCDFTQPENSDNGSEQTGTCEPCAGLLSTEECSARGASPLGARECVERCEGVMPPSCSTNEDCQDVNYRSFFCNAEWNACEVCPQDQCRIGSRDGTSLENCNLSCNKNCFNRTQGVISVEALADIGDTAPSDIASHFISFSNRTSVSGPLIECQSQEGVTCPANASTNFVCLFPEADCWQCDLFLRGCKESGGIAMAYKYKYFFDQREVQVDVDEQLPALGLTYRDTQRLLENGLGLITKVTTWVKEECTIGCSDRVPCPFSPRGLYCDYNKGNYGTCIECFPNKNEDKQTDEVRSATLLSTCPTCRMSRAHLTVCSASSPVSLCRERKTALRLVRARWPLLAANSAARASP